ncbi:hypothetical protein TrRE_jg727, partial [Triparma retinervis]
MPQIYKPWTSYAGILQCNGYKFTTRSHNTKRYINNKTNRGKNRHTKTALSSSTRPSGRGLSRANQKLLSSQSLSRQVVVPQSDPLTLSITPCPTRRWLKREGTGILTVNGTLISSSLANLESLTWLDSHTLPTPLFSLEYLCEITHRSPAYIRTFPSPTSPSHETLCITSFGLRSSRGTVSLLSGESGKTKRFKSTFPWPNECLPLPPPRPSKSRPSPPQGVLVTDGFLLPTRTNGGIYHVSDPTLQSEATVRLTPTTSEKEGGWYYHRATPIDLTGDGRMSILTARARAPGLSAVDSMGELCWLEMPLPPLYDPVTLEGLESDGRTPFDPYSSRHAPWKLRVLAEGPDVMFSVGKLGGGDGTVEVIAAEFFNQRVTLHEVTLGRRGGG